MYSTMWMCFYEPYMARDIYKPAAWSILCTRNRHTIKQQRRLRLYRPAGYLDLVAIDILGATSSKEGGYTYVVLIIDCYSRVIKSSSTARTTVPRIMSTFMERSVANFRVPSKVLTDSPFQIISKLLAALWNEPGFRAVIATEYHLLASRSVEWITATMISTQCTYVTKKQKTWDTFLYSLAYADSS